MHMYLDSGSEAPDDIDDTKGITIDVESSSRSDNRELVGTGQTIPTINYWGMTKSTTDWEPILSVY